MKVYLVRHGQTDWNAARRIQGDTDIPLNERGRAVARATAEGMRDIPVDVMFSSPLIRAYETAQILAEGRGIEIRRDLRLREICFGEYEGFLLEEIKAREDICVHNFFRDPANYVPDRGAESIEALYARAGAFLRDEVLPREKTCDTMMIVAHGALNRAFLSCVQGASKAEFWGGTRKPSRNCAVNLLEVRDGKIQILEEGKLYYDPALFE